MAVERRTTALTERQRAVLALVARGRSNREIAGDLGITEDGVKAHLSRLFLRFGVTNRVELLTAANVLPTPDRTVTEVAPLGDLRVIAGRASAAADMLRTSAPTSFMSSQLNTVRDALAAVDVALELVRELPTDATGPLVAALRKRLATAFEALENAERAAALPQ